MESSGQAAMRRGSAVPVAGPEGTIAGASQICQGSSRRGLPAKSTCWPSKDTSGSAEAKKPGARSRGSTAATRRMAAPCGKRSCPHAQASGSNRGVDVRGRADGIAGSQRQQRSERQNSGGRYPPKLPSSHDLAAFIHYLQTCLCLTPEVRMVSRGREVYNNLLILMGWEYRAPRSSFSAAAGKTQINADRQPSTGRSAEWPPPKGVIMAADAKQNMWGMAVRDLPHDDGGRRRSSA